MRNTKPNAFRLSSKPCSTCEGLHRRKTGIAKQSNKRSRQKKGLVAIEGSISSRISEGQTGLALLDATVTGTKARDLETTLHRLVIGQEEAIHEIVRTYQTYLAGLSPNGRLIGRFLFLGPTGTGKTGVVPVRR